MDSTVVVQTNGLGCSFQASRNSPIAFCKSSTLLNDPRRTRLQVSSPNHRSTRFNQLELVGTKCGMKRGWRLSQPCTFACLCVPYLSITRCNPVCPLHSTST